MVGYGYAWVMSLSDSKRLKVFTRDSFTCQYCGATGVALEVDHVTPRTWPGGSDDVTNLVTACAACNNRKDDLDLKLYAAFLRARDGVDTRAMVRRVRAALKRRVK